jgi:hypothetical protein
MSHLGTVPYGHTNDICTLPKITYDQLKSLQPAKKPAGRALVDILVYEGRFAPVCYGHLQVEMPGS